MSTGRPWQYDCRARNDYVKNVITIVNDGRKHALMSLQKAELNRRNLSVGSWVELRSFERTEDQFEMKTYGALKIETRKQKKNKGKHEQVEELGDMYVKNWFGISMLNPLRCSSSY